MTRVNHLLPMVAPVLLFGCGQTTTDTGDVPLRPVRTAVVSSAGGQRERAFTGLSQSTQESRMSFRVGGTVIELPVQVGDDLKKGDLIARLNPSTYELTVQQSDAALAQALANQRNADASYSRTKELYENNNASRNELDGARASAESARAQVRSARKSLEIAQLNRSYTRLEAAADCTIAQLDVDLNENVNAGTPVARVNCGSDIEVRVGVPEGLITDLKRGMDASIRFNAVRDRQFAGTVTEIGTAPESGAATFPVVVSLNDTDPAVRPGMAAEVALAFERSSDGSILVIPAAAVINDERGTFVFVAKPTDAREATIQRRAVRIGELTADGIQVLDGLSPGDHVVTAGTTVIRENQTVLLPESPAR
ncbi:MAG: efflux RND transporter periplasmic adaptor subunit [Pseudomonadota bacterium]